MAVGYSLLTAKRIREADTRLLGVRLGQLCLERDIPVKDIAEFVGVSRMTVYSWFQGSTSVTPKLTEKVEKLIAKLQ